jgi:hypothetical protein
MRFHSVARWMLLASLLVPTSSLAAAPLDILWDDSHDGVELTNDELAGNYSDFADLLEAEGHAITELDGTPGSITAAALLGYDVLMFFDSEREFTGGEVTVIQDFVTAGGKLFVAGDVLSPTTVFASASFNFLLLPYGVSFTTPDLTNVAANDLTVFAVDPLTTGLTNVDMVASSTLSVVGAGTKVLGSTAAPGNRVGYAYGANGAVVVLSDSDLLINANLNAGDNEETLIKNLLAFWAGPEETPPPAPIELTLDIRPGESPNAVNPKNNGVVHVAILTTSVASGDAADFDPWDSVDPSTVAFGPGQAAPDKEPAAEDVDLDGDLDMVLRFRTQDTGVACGLTEMTLTALSFDEESLVGSDSITTPGCK